MEGREWEDLDLLASGALYRFIQRRVFRYLTSLNLASTQVTDRHFLQMIRSSTTLEVLDISYCTGISQVAIFQARDNLDYVQHIAISSERQLTILAVTCMCSCQNIVTIRAHALQLSAEELLFLRKLLNVLHVAMVNLKQMTAIIRCTSWTRFIVNFSTTKPGASMDSSVERKGSFYKQ